VVIWITDLDRYHNTGKTCLGALWRRLADWKAL